MSNCAIEVDCISKRFILGENQFRPNNIGEGFSRYFARLLRKTADSGVEAIDEHWALREVSFKIRPGELVGIIGRNGAGKSTLLKILSRITHPTSGSGLIRGRLSSLLEVGTGFHPELTGRENIFLNGAILGMSHREIASRLEEIVAFSEISKFLDTPVKRYSSGMYVRLAFAVAAHLEPEILIVDEVLAVGDAAFQKRCLNKMESVQKSGRTILFVSHSMSAITRLCPRAILLEKGEIKADGPSAEVVAKYLGGDSGRSFVREFSELETAPGNEIARLRAIRIDSEGLQLGSLDIRKELRISMTYAVTEAGYTLIPNLHVYNDEGICVFVTIDSSRDCRQKPKTPGLYCSSVVIPGNFLAEGSFYVGAALSTFEPLQVHFWEQDIVAFQVVDTLDGGSARGDFAGPIPGVVRPMLTWETIEIDA